METMTFDARERAVLAALADVLIPAGNGFPSASEAGVAAAGLDEALAVRPDLAPGLRRILAAAAGRSAAEFIAELQKKDPGAFGVLTEIIPGAYFLNPQVQAGLGYDGQAPQPLDARPDFDDSLLQPVRERGPICRPTPRGAKS